MSRPTAPILSRRSTALILALAAAAPWVAAQTAPPGAAAPAGKWPTKTVRIIVGFPGGSSPDLTARTFAEPLSKALKPGLREWQ